LVDNDVKLDVTSYSFSPEVFTEVSCLAAIFEVLIFFDCLSKFIFVFDYVFSWALKLKRQGPP
jgi:hypothetical protein